MSFLDSLRKIFAGPTRIGDGSAEDAATLQEEFGATSAGEADLKHMEETGGGGGLTGIRYGASESAEAAEEDLASEEPPPDPDP